MLAAIDISLRADEECQLPHPCAHLLHAAVLDLVRLHNPAAAKMLHDDAQVKPFTVSTLITDRKPSSGTVSIPKEAKCSVRVCTAGKDAFDAIICPLFNALNVERLFHLKGFRFSATAAVMNPPLGGVESFKDMLDQPAATAEMQFVSPTTFRRKGLNVPLPDPQLVYGSLFQKWQTFSGLPASEELFQEMSSVIALTRTRISTSMWRFPRFVLVGFEGTAVYELTKSVSRDAYLLFAALSKLSFYTGVGYRTTMGMGQCRPSLNK